MASLPERRKTFYNIDPRTASAAEAKSASAPLIFAIAAILFLQFF
jgi:hypothetical protein